MKKANKQFYDIIADDYERIDVRRSPTTLAWLKKKMQKIACKTNKGMLLDLGCGNGFIIRAAKNVFKSVYGVDISYKVILPIKNQATGVACADGFSLPFRDNTFDAVSCFAVLHHCYEHKTLLTEIHRVLKPSGVFYSDHDLDAEFMKNFYIPMKIYRYFFDFEQKYLEKNKNISEELYHLTEYYSEGVPSQRIIRYLSDVGFRYVKASRHWLGLNDAVTKILLHLNVGNCPKGIAPLFCVIARK